MSIAHELSSEIAIAILTRKEQTADLNDLKEIVLRVHNSLQNLTFQEHRTKVVGDVFKFSKALLSCESGCKR